MELITHLQVTNFPWLQDWTIRLWQDTFIEWKYWSGKTSVLKAISYLFTGKDLQWNTIPNINEKTRVISRWLFDMSRTQEWANISSLNWLLKWEAKDILARIVPWFLLSWALTNTEIVESLSWIKYKTFDYWYWKIETIESTIKELESYKKSIKLFSESFRHLTLIKRHFSIKWIPIQVDELIDYLEDWHKPLNFLDTNLNTDKVNTIKIFTSLKEWYKSKDAHILCDKIITWIETEQDNSFSSQQHIRWWKSLLRDYFNSVSTVYDLLNNSIKNTKWAAMSKSTPTFSWDLFRTSVMESYYTIVDRSFVADEQKNALTTTKNKYIETINDSLWVTWIKVSWNFQLTINVRDKLWETSLLALPRHRRFLYEVLLCSRIQDILLNSNGWSSNRRTWIILIDDYIFDNDDDSIDNILTESLDHQVIITRTDNTKESLEININ